MGLKDALLKAYAEKGETPPVVKGADPMRVVLAQGSKGQTQLVVVKKGQSTGRRASKVDPFCQKFFASSATPPPTSTGRRQHGKDSGGRRLENLVVSPPSTSVPKTVNRSDLQVNVPLPDVRLDAGARCLVKISENLSNQLLDLDVTLGLKDSIHQLSSSEVHEMALGLDFGTSSVKVVIGDLASDKSYAVPFIDAVGIDAYLLPSRVFESVPASTSIATSSFCLSEAEHAFRDLKLSLLGNPESAERQVEVIAFLALVIQRARAWLFTQHKAVYKRVRCLWQLRIGLPAATALNSAYVPLLENVLRSAWLLAGTGEQPNRRSAKKIRDQVFSSNGQDDDLEVQVIPEITAQIFGFVASNSFDKKAANRYLMVDVGAGTVDASLFKVIPGRGGSWDFEFYTAVVQPYGVSNLHAHRVDWWLPKLTNVDGASTLTEALRSTKFATDLGATVPVYNQEYFEGVHLTKASPDQADLVFFEKLMAQVQGSTLWRAWKDGFLSKDQLTNTPMFLCGGGARSDFYLKLESKLVRFPSFAWLSAEPWQLGLPRDLESEAIDEKDFDRLSVAYGLSKLNVGQITQANPLPKVTVEPAQPFTDRYIDKDQT